MRRMVIAALLVVLAFGMATIASAQTKEPRFPALKPEQMTEVQKKVYETIAGGPRGGVRGPFGPLLRSPELADRVQKLGWMEAVLI